MIIRTPINGIMGMVDIIRKNRNDWEKVDDSLEKDPAFDETSVGTGKRCTGYGASWKQVCLKLKKMLLI